MSVIKFCLFLIITFVESTRGQQGACAPPKQTGVISFIQEVFFNNGPANFAAGTHPSGIIAVLQSSAGLEKATGFQTTRALLDGVVGYVQKINCTFYYFPTSGCEIKPYPLSDCEDIVPNLSPITNSELLRFVKRISEPYPYCTPCSTYTFRTFSISPSPTGAVPGANVIFEHGNTLGAYLTTFNCSGYDYTTAAKEYAISRGYSIDVYCDNGNTILSERKCPKPRKCKRTPNNLLRLSAADIAEITSLGPGSACCWASAVSEFLSTTTSTGSQLLYASFGFNKRDKGGAYFGEGYVPATTWNTLFDGAFNSFCS